MNAYLNELINSRITLNDKETALVEEYIENHSHPVKPSHLAHYECVAAIRGAGSCSTFADRYRK
jgi:hypothetical protein